MATAERAYRALFADLAAGIAADITRAADADGVVPRSATLDLQRRANDRVQALFLGRNRAGELAPFELLANGRLLPLSPYMRILWAAITAAVRLPVEQTAADLARRLPADVLAVLRRGTADPFAVARAQVREVEVFRPNPLAQYDAPHTWVDPNGYQLSDRVWNTTAATRAKLDAYLEDSIRQGKGALAMSKELEQFLIPGKAALKTSKPYGTKASYDAMRLARTEITRAHGQAHLAAGAMNPFVTGDKWNLSPSHPKPDICDTYARGGPNGDGVYPTGTLPGYPAHCHCLCYITYATTADPDAVIDALRADIRKARQELVNQIGPVQTAEFEALLLGQTPAARPAVIPAVAPSVAPPLPATARPTRPPVPPLPVDLAPLTDATTTVVWGKDPRYAGVKLNGVALKPAAARNWAKIRKVATDEPALPAGQRVSTGLVIVEPDGRMWVVEPANHFGGYQQTWPKGGLETGLSPQQNALKEAWEESGLHAKITGYVGDFQGTTGVTRYYLAKRTGGAPWLSDIETATVKLVPADQVAGLLNVQRDRDVLEAALRKLYPERYSVPAPVAPPPVVPPPAAPGAIPDLDQLKFVKRLGGSTGAELFEDATGTRYVVKSGSSNEHVRSEYLADELYRTLGANVPRARLVERDGKAYKIAEYIDGTLLSELSGSKLTAAHWQLQKHFAADALLGSWDVIGLGADNIIVDRQGKAWRIDNGGSLLFRAQGAPKALGNYLDELWTLRDSAINQQTSNVFGSMKYSEIANQLSAIVSQRDAIIGQIGDPTLRSVMTARLDHAADLAQIYRTFHDDKYVDAYVDRFSFHNTWIQSSGVTKTLPRRLERKSPKGFNVVLVDETGKEWDDLRGKNGIYAKFLAELDRRTNGEGAEFVKQWASSQAFSSWSGASRLVKESLMKNRPSDSYFYRPVAARDQAWLDQLRGTYDHGAVTDFSAALNALSYETLRRVEVGNRPVAGLITLIRTESDDVLDRYGLKRKKGATALLERGAAESTSLLQGVSVEGSYMTEQDIPLHRVIGFYGFGIDRTMYANDAENELLVLLDGFKSRYVRKL